MFILFYSGCDRLLPIDLVNANPYFVVIMHHVTSHFIQYMQLMYFSDRMHWSAECLALRTRNGRLKELFVAGETLPTHSDCPTSLWTSYMMGLFYGLHIDHTFTPLHKIPDREDDAIFVGCLNSVQQFPNLFFSRLLNIITSGYWWLTHNKLWPSSYHSLPQGFPCGY